MKSISRRMKVTLLLCAALGVAGGAVAYVHRFVAAQIEAAIRGLGEGRVRVAGVRGNLLRGMSIEGFELVRDQPGETRLHIRLPQIRVVYDLLGILSGRHRPVPSAIEVTSPTIDIERRGPRLELYKLVDLLAILRRDLENVPIRVLAGHVRLAGDFPWQRPLDLSLEEALLEWNSIGLTYRATAGWKGSRVSASGSYDPGAALGRMGWEARRVFERESLAAAFGVGPSAPTSSPAPPGGQLDLSLLTGTLEAGGELLYRTRLPFPTDGVRHWNRFELERIGPVAIAWESAAKIDRAAVEVPGFWGTMPLTGFRVSWPSGRDASWSLGLGALGGKVALQGRAQWPLAPLPEFTARFEGIRPGRLAPLASAFPQTIASGTLDARGPFPWGYRLQLGPVALPQVPGPLTAELEGRVSPERLEIARWAARQGKAVATGKGSVELADLSWAATAEMTGIPPEWLARATCVQEVHGNGVRASVEARGRLAPPSLAHGTFKAHAAALTVGGVSAGDIEAHGSFGPSRLTFDSVRGTGKAQLFSSFAAKGKLEAGKPAELSGTVRGLRLDAFSPAVKGVAQADVKLGGGRHEIHARVLGFELAAADVRIPELTLDLVPRGTAEALTIALPARGKVEASLVWSPSAAGKLQAAGSFRLPEVSFLLGPKGFLRGGKTSGSFRFSVDPATGPQGDFSIVDLKLATQRGPLLADGPITGTYHRGRLVFARSAITLAGGRIGFEGVTGAADSGWDFKLQTADLPIHLDGLGGGAGALSGRLHSTFQLSGALTRPTLVADLRLEKPKLPGQGAAAGRVLQRVSGRISYRDGVLTTEKLVLHGGGQECTVTGRMPIELSLSPFSASPGTSPMELRVVFPKTPLSVAALLLPWLPPDSVGSFQADLAVSGTPANPKIEGLLMANAARLQLAALPAPLTALTAKIVFGDRRAHLRELTAEMAGGKLTGKGGATFGEGLKMAWNVDLEVVGLQVARKNLTLSDLAVKTHLGGEPGRLDIDSQFTFEKGMLDLALFDSPASGFFDSIPDTVSYKISGASKGNFWIRSSSVNAELRGALEMKGRGPDYQIGGELNAARGHIFFQGNRFAVESGTVAYRTPPVSDPSLFPWQKPAPEARRPKSVPYINARGAKEIGRTTVYMEVNGPAEHMNFTLRSLPAHTEEEILAILATRSDADVTLAPSDEVVSKMITAPLSAKFDDQFLNRPVGSAVRRATGLDEFRIDTNLLQTDRATPITPQIRAGKYLGKNVFVAVDGRVGADGQALDHLGVQYQIEKNLALTVDKNLEVKTLQEDLSRYLRPEETRVGMEYKLRW
ncbi:MAG: translocation/assembly module TamB domain-containing protein [Candidatus Wallbacteria bacterium]|nr:translocation/assembly module TamB domain-containing protein [Candidatus Wallbacteria bacterium]